MSDGERLDRAERRRRARAEQKARRRANHPRHGHDPEAVMIQLTDEATELGIAGLITMSDFDLDGLPEGSVEFARSVFAPDFSVDRGLQQLTQLVATVCELWADLQADPDQAEESMLRRCGLIGSFEGDLRRIEMRDATLFSTTSMLIVNRVALLGERPIPHR